MKNIWVQYFPGDCGTFVSWFINQHSGFVGPLCELSVHSPVHNEVVCNHSTWEWRPDPHRHSIKDPDVRYAFKTYTEHNCTNADAKSPQDHLQFLNTVKNCEALASVLLTVPQAHHDRFADRLRHSFNSFDPGQTADDFYHNRISEYSQARAVHGMYLSDVPLYEIDVYELLFATNDIEYQRLCVWLDTQPLPHWKTLCNFYTQQVFDSIGPR